MLREDNERKTSQAEIHPRNIPLLSNDFWELVALSKKQTLPKALLCY